MDGGTGSFSALLSGGAGGTYVGNVGGSYEKETYTGVHAGSGGTQIAGGAAGVLWTGEERTDTYLGTDGAFGIGGNGGYELKYVQGSGAGGGGYYGGGRRKRT